MEVCANIQAIKYLFKYFTKGDARIQAILAAPPPTIGASLGAPAPVDEVSEFQEGRFVSAVEAEWRINEYPMSQRIPNVVRLEVHLEDQQRVHFR